MEPWEVREWRNACAVLKEAHRSAWDDLFAVLRDFRLYKSAILQPGGGKSPISSAIDTALYGRGWREAHFETAIVVGAERTDSPTHKIDCFKDKVALEIEWNNKDPFYDRDLNNFRLLFELRVIDVGVIVTRCDSLQAIFDSLGKGRSYGASTTHMSKLLHKVEGGGAGGCPVVVFGIGDELYVEDC
jgi:Restriction endonuclease BglII